VTAHIIFENSFVRNITNIKTWQNALNLRFSDVTHTDFALEVASSYGPYMSLHSIVSQSREKPALFVFPIPATLNPFRKAGDANDLLIIYCVMYNMRLARALKQFCEDSFTIA
jgi:hypothetical protein